MWHGGGREEGLALGSVLLSAGAAGEKAWPRARL
jgi:hypothetical protein